METRRSERRGVQSGGTGMLTGIKTVTAVVLLMFALNAGAQDMLGTTLGNYSGINGIQLNPSSMLSSRTYLDIQLAGLGVFVGNNALYMSKDEYRFLNFFSAGYQWPTHPEGYGTEERIFYRYDNTRDKRFFINSRLNGPGAMLLWGKHAFALSTALRAEISLSEIPYDISNFGYIGLNYRPQQNINYDDKRPFRMAGMAWGEIGLSYAWQFYSRGFNSWSAGITVKRLFGIAGMYARVNKINYIVLNDSTVDIKNLDGDMGIAMPTSLHNNSAFTSPMVKGGGFGFDFGVTYQRLAHYHQDPYFSTLCAQPYEDYLYRVGFSLVDIGRVKFRNNARELRIDNRSSYWEHVTSMPFSTLDRFLDTLSYKFYGDTVTAYTGNSFSIWLPSAVSVQFDYHFRKPWYINAGIIYGFPLSKGAIVRPTVLSITPRFETSIVEVSLPLSLYDWTQPRMGLAVRVYSVTIGTDKLGGFFHFSEFTGMDFYISLKLSFSKGNCRIKGPVHCGEKDYRIKQ